MKKLLFKTQIFIFLFFGFTVVFAQKSMKVPQNAVFYMEINGKELNQKINWEKFNPMLQEISKKDKKFSWNDFSKTGIKYDAVQQHYATINDSIQTYTTHFTLENKEKFQEFINSVKKKGLEATKRKNYSYIDIDNDSFVAWNDTRAVLKVMNYQKPYKNVWSDDYAADSVAVVVDSAAVAIDSAYIEEEKPFDYKEEIEYLKDDIKYLKQNVKDNNAEILKLQKDIKYLEKHHKYPEEKNKETKVEDSAYSEDQIEAVPPPPVSNEDYYGHDDYEVDSSYQKVLDSIDREEYKILKIFAEKDFDEYFNSNLNIQAAKEILNFRDSGSDAFIYADYNQIFNQRFYRKVFRGFNFNGLLGNMYNSHSAYNLYFDKDKVRLVNNYQHKNNETQNLISEVYQGKKNKKLAALINDKSVGYYVFNLNGYKYFDMMYSLIKDAGGTEYQKEMDVMMETLKIALDEEAIAKIAPGNGIFVLNELKSKNVEYTDYDYDENYNEKEIKKTKDVMVPDFTFAIATENESYWKRIFDMMTTTKEMSKKFSKDGDFYIFKDGKGDGYLEKLFFTIKNGIVYLTTSKENVDAKNQSSVSKGWMKDSAKYPLSGRLNIQKLLSGLDQEIKGKSERKALDVFRKNVGEMYFKTEVKGQSIQTEMNYNINNSSENSLMYFFDLFDELYKIFESDKSAKAL